MSTNEHSEHSHHVASMGELFKTFLALSLLMAITVWSKYWDLGSPLWNNLINLGIAVTKATLVVSFFMGLKYGSSLTKTFGHAGFVWLLLITITFGDYTTRQWEPSQGWYQLDQGDRAPTYDQATEHFGSEKVVNGQEPGTYGSGALPIEESPETIRQ